MTIHKVGGGSGKPRACLTLTEADTLRADLTHWQEVCYAHEAELQCLRAETARLRSVIRVNALRWAPHLTHAEIDAIISEKAAALSREMKP